MTNRLTLAQAQDRLIKRVVEAHQGHQKRVLAAARKQLFAWAIAGGYTQDEAIVVCNDACDMLSLALKEKEDDLAEGAANVEQTVEQKTVVQTTTQQNTTETTKENDMAAVTKPQQKTYTIAQKVTGNEVEVMPLAQLQALVKSRIEAGEDPQTVVGFVGLEYEGDMYYGITSELNGTASALEDGLDIRFWWEDEYNEIGFKWLWEEPEAKEEKQILASKLLELVADKGCVEVTADVYLQTSEKILSEWPANPQFAQAPFWITYGQCPLFSSPVSDAEDHALVGLVAENSEKVAKLIEAHQADKVNARLLELVEAKGCIQVTAGVYVQTAQNLIDEQVTWGPEDLSFDSDFSVAPFWITTDSGDDPVPVEGHEDSELAALVAENAEEITKIIEARHKDGVTLCEVDPDTMTFTVVV